MTFHLLELPEDPDARVEALEGHLLEDDFPQAVGTLLAVHELAPEDAVLPPPLSEGERERILRAGLSTLTPERLDELLRRPLEWLHLREHILVSDAPYWCARLAAPASVSSHSPRTREPKRAAAPFVSSIVLLAAGVLIGVALTWFLQREERAWGWLAQDALEETATAREYLERLAAQGEQWFAVRPTNATALARRANELRMGCSRLIFARHESLALADREWLVTKCRAWAVALDEQLALLEAGSPVEERLEAFDEIVTQLAHALRTRASTVS